MAHHADQHEHKAQPAAQFKLVKLSDAGFRIEDPALDIRGLGVFNRDGKRLGKVKDLYIDTEKRKIRFLDVGAGSFLGLGERRFLIPVEAVAGIGDDDVTVDYTHE